MFTGRRSALFELSEILPFAKGREDEWITISVSDSALFMAYELYKISGVKFEHLFIEPVKAPKNSDVNLAMVSETGTTLIDEKLINAFEIEEQTIQDLAHRELVTVIEGEVHRYRGGERLQLDSSKKALLLNDGLETGLQMATAVESLRSLGFQSISIATPLFPETLFKEFSEMVEAVYTLKRVIHFTDTSDYYEQPKWIEDELLDKIWFCIKSLKGDIVEKR
jgi:putative phosphoribosyl transferase